LALPNLAGNDGDALVTGTLAGGRLGFAPPIVLTLVHTLHFLRREGTVKAFPVQVRIGYLLWMLAGLWGSLGFFYWILLAGTGASVLADYCLMARIVSLLPWYRRAPLTWRLVVRTFRRPPVPGSILGAV
jgi:hypothetical protein